MTDAVAGVMVYGTVSKSWFDYMMENFERQDRLAGLTDGEIADAPGAARGVSAGAAVCR